MDLLRSFHDPDIRILTRFHTRARRNFRKSGFILGLIFILLVVSCAGRERVAEKISLPPVPPRPSPPPPVVQQMYEPEVRVLVKRDLTRVSINDGAYVIKTTEGDIVSRGGRRITLLLDEGKLQEGENQFNGELHLLSESPVSIDGVLYSGEVVFYPTNSGIDIIDQIQMERYIASVLKSEIPSSFSYEAKKALAVAVRSYTLYRMEKGTTGYYHLDNSNISQVYGGIAGVEEEFKRAAEETRGTVVTYRGRPALTVYHASCGGHTESARDVWLADVPYLLGVPCSYCVHSPGYRWLIEMAPADFLGLLRGEEVLGRNLLSIEPGALTETGRVRTLKVKTEEGSWEIDSSKLRARAGYARMKSVHFSVSLSRGKIAVRGKGYGHGVGLCQYGADGLANRGYDFREILKYYYGRGVRITQYY